MSVQPERNGQRVKTSSDPKQYLILDGIRRYIQNWDTVNNLFIAGDPKVDDSINSIAEGSYLSDGAVLARPTGGLAVYLVSNGVKRWIVSPEILAKYSFDGSKIVNVPQVVVDSIQTGADIAN